MSGSIPTGLRVGMLTTSMGTDKHFFSEIQRVKRHIGVKSFSTSNTAKLQFVQFQYKCNPCEIRVGYLKNGDVVDINKFLPGMPSTMLGILQSDCMNEVICLKNCLPPAEPISCVTLMAPITGMDKVLCVALNYADHCKEKKIALPKIPILFSKFASTIIGPNEPLKIRSQMSKEVDWEVELAVVIGKKCTNIKAADAYNYVFGYTVAQDITSRDWLMKNAGQFLLAKNQDAFCPIGPCIVTKDEIPNPQNLELKCSVNGVAKQRSNTCNLIHKIPDVLERLASLMTLLPGDIYLSGTPAGVGGNRKPPEYLKSGDVIRSEIQNIGAFEVRVENY